MPPSEKGFLSVIRNYDSVRPLSREGVMELTHEAAVQLRRWAESRNDLAALECLARAEAFMTLQATELPELTDATQSLAPPRIPSEFRHPFEPLAPNTPSLAGGLQFCRKCGCERADPIHQGGTHAR